MKKLCSMFVVLCLVILTGCSEPIVPPTINGDGTIVFIVYDRSGSMNENIQNSNGQSESKVDIANRALLTVGRRFDNYLASSPNRNLGLGLVVLLGGSASFENFVILNGGVEKYLIGWINHQSSPNGGTPLGTAMNLADENMIKIKGTNRKHIIVLTDGESNKGVEPKQALATIMRNENVAGVDLGFHLIAFDVGSNIFDPLKEQGATILAAKDETQLNAQFDVILTEKILLEKEE